MTEQVAQKPVRVPGPDHPITIEPNGSRVIVWAGGQPIADTRNAITLEEAGHSSVQYLPLADVDTSLLLASDHSTYCPYKGDCSYYSIPTAPRGENAVWEYRSPFPAVARIKDHVAFYPDRVDRIEERNE
jgi:uncharacterized protein (DUF427 family)